MLGGDRAGLRCGGSSRVRGILSTTNARESVSLQFQRALSHLSCHVRVYISPLLRVCVRTCAWLVSSKECALYRLGP